MIIERSMDVEDAVRLALKDYFTVYCRPLPEDFEVPSLLVTLTGGNDDNKIDAFNVSLDARAETEGEALDLLLDATATLQMIAKLQLTDLRYVVVNTCGSWGRDPVRPEMAMATAQLSVYTHKITKTINSKGE